MRMFMPRQVQELEALRQQLQTTVGELTFEKQLNTDELMSLEVTSVYGLAGHWCIWPGGSLVYMAWRVTSVCGLVGH